mgnify:FL=1
MSDVLGAVMGGTEAAAVAEIAEQAALEQRVPISAGEIYLVRKGDGGFGQIDTDDYAANPRHERASRTVTDAKSFVDYVNRHKRDGTEVFAHTAYSAVVAVIDSHEATGGVPGHQQHTLRLALEKSKAWEAWEAIDGKLLEQGAFADLLDDRYIDFIDPDPARMIDIATTFQAKTGVDFDSGIRTDNGEVKLSYKETVTARAGQTGEIEIPKKVQLALRPYVGGPIYYIWAHFRYRLRGASVSLGFKLERPENVLDAAFADIVTEISDGRTDKKDDVETRVHDGIGDVPIFNGKP